MNLDLRDGTLSRKILTSPKIREMWGTRGIAIPLLFGLEDAL